MEDNITYTLPDRTTHTETLRNAISEGHWRIWTRNIVARRAAKARVSKQILVVDRYMHIFVYIIIINHLTHVIFDLKRENLQALGCVKLQATQIHLKCTHCLSLPEKQGRHKFETVWRRNRYQRTRKHITHERFWILSLFQM